jgi:hypothetical protein
VVGRSPAATTARPTSLRAATASSAAATAWSGLAEPRQQQHDDKNNDDGFHGLLGFRFGGSEKAEMAAAD